MNSFPNRKVSTTIAVSAGVLLALSGCSDSAPSNRPDPAEPVYSSAACSESVGSESLVTIKDADARTGIRDLMRSGDSIAGLVGDHIAIGTASQWQQGDPTLISVNAKCQDLSRFDGGFTLACPGEVLTFDTQGKQQSPLKVDGDVTTAARVGDTTVLTLANERKVHFYQGDKHVGDASMENIPRQSLVVDSDPNEPEATAKVAMLDPSMTMVTGVNVDDKSVGASLRVGRGAGRMSGGEDGVFVVSDTRGNALYMYTLTDLIRLHQTIPTAKSPWAVAWDPASGHLWGASSADNSVSGYAVASGALVQQAQLPTLPQPDALAVLPGGGLLVGAKDRPVVQVISAQQIAQAQPAADTETEFPVTLDKSE